MYFLGTSLLSLVYGSGYINAQSTEYAVISINPEEMYQTVEGFGASLAFYENWLTAHPKKNEIYDAIFGELSLDILRVRNAYSYDPGMVGRVSEFAQAAENSLGKPIAILSTSWGPPGYLKSNNDRKNGGTLKYSMGENGVEFDYAGFAGWWSKSLDEYNAHGIYPTYISIQNEPDWAASWETCLLQPAEKVDAADTIAGYNKALDAVYDTVMKREIRPKFLGPETVGIGYNAVENYVNALEISKLYGIAHHLYHGVDENDPYSTTDMSKVGNFHPEIPHFQSEYSLGDWFSLAGLMYKSFHDEKVVAYLYWDLIWDGGGLVSLDFPWDQSQWTDPQKGYTKSREFYVFKQFSAFIHPGWKQIGSSMTGTNGRALAFCNSGRDSAVLVVINRSSTDSISIHASFSGYSIYESLVFRTSESENCEYQGGLSDSIFVLTPRSVATVEMKITEIIAGIGSGNSALVSDGIICKSLYPNPFSQSAILQFHLKEHQQIWLTILDSQGRIIRKSRLGDYTTGDHTLVIDRAGIPDGIYFYRLENSQGRSGIGKFILQ